MKEGRGIKCNLKEKLKGTVKIKTKEGKKC